MLIIVRFARFNALAVCLFFGCAFPLVHAQTPPAWWDASGVTNANPQLDGGVVAVGQAKHLVQKAYFYLESELVAFGGAGSSLDAHYAQYCGSPPTNPADDLRIITMGQAKFLAKPFYDRLMEVQFDPSTMNPALGNYPWTDSLTDDEDDAPITLGQLKFVFSFDLSRSEDDDSIPDWWENYWFSGTGVVSQFSDYEADGINDYAEFLIKLDPTSVQSLDLSGDSDGDLVLNNNDAAPFDPAIGALDISITYPLNGSTVN